MNLDGWSCELAQTSPEGSWKAAVLTPHGGLTGPFKLKAGENMPTRRPGAVARVARRVQREARRLARPRVTDTWDRLLSVITLASVQHGVLPTTWNLAFDSTPIESGVHFFGQKTCTCTTHRCHCQRYFSEPMALIGWDSHRHRYYFGYSPQVAVVANPGPDGKSHPLIVSIALHPANRHDGIAFPNLLVKTQRLYARSGPASRYVSLRR